MPSECTRPRADSRVRQSGSTAAMAPYAPSTCSHSPSSSHKSASSSSGSIAPVPTVPALATTQNGRLPSRRSAAMALRSAGTSISKRSLAGMTCTPAPPMPSSSAAFRAQVCPSDDMYITNCGRPVCRPSSRTFQPSAAAAQCRAAARHVSVAIEPPLTKNPHALARGKAHQLHQPAHATALEINRRMVAPRTAGIHGCGQQIAQNAHRFRRRIDIAKKPRMPIPHRVRQNLRLGHAQNRIGRTADVRQRLRQNGRSLLGRHRLKHRLVGQPVQMIQGEIHRPMRRLAKSLRDTHAAPPVFFEISMSTS